MGRQRKPKCKGGAGHQEKADSDEVSEDKSECDEFSKEQAGEDEVSKATGGFRSFQPDYDFNTWNLPEGKTFDDVYTSEYTRSVVEENSVTKTIQMRINNEEELRKTPHLHGACLWNEVQKHLSKLYAQGKDVYVKACIQHPLFSYTVKTLLWPPSYFKGFAMNMMGHPKLPPEYTLTLKFITIGEHDQPLPCYDCAPFTDPEKFVGESESPRKIPPTLWHAIPLCPPPSTNKDDSLYTIYLDCRIIETDLLLTEGEMNARTVKEIVKRYLFEAYLRLLPKNLDGLLVDLQIDDGRYKLYGDAGGCFKENGWRPKTMLPHSLMYDEIEKGLVGVEIGDRFIMKVTYGVVPSFMEHRMFTRDCPSEKHFEYAGTSTNLVYKYLKSTESHLYLLEPKEGTGINIQDLYHIDHMHHLRDSNVLEYTMRIRDAKHYVLYNMPRSEVFGLLLVDLAIDIILKFVNINGEIALAMNIYRPSQNDNKSIEIPFQPLRYYSGGYFLWKTEFGDGAHYTGEITVKMKFVAKGHEEYKLPTELSLLCAEFTRKDHKDRCVKNVFLPTEYETYLHNIHWSPLVVEPPPSGNGAGFRYTEILRTDQRHFLCGREYIIRIKSRDSYSYVAATMINMLTPFMKRFIGNVCLDVGAKVEDYQTKECVITNVVAAEIVDSHQFKGYRGFNPRKYKLTVVFIGPHTNRYAGLVDEILLDNEPTYVYPFDCDRAAKELQKLFGHLNLAEKDEAPQKKTK